MIFIAIGAARDVFAIICVECGAGECGANFHAVPKALHSPSMHELSLNQRSDFIRC